MGLSWFLIGTKCSIFLMDRGFRSLSKPLPGDPLQFSPREMHRQREGVIRFLVVTMIGGTVGGLLLIPPNPMGVHFGLFCT